MSPVKGAARMRLVAVLDGAQMGRFHQEERSDCRRGNDSRADVRRSPVVAGDEPAHRAVLAAFRAPPHLRGDPHGARFTMSLLAIDLGGTKLASAIFTTEGDLRLRESVSLDGRRGRAVGALIAEHARALRARESPDPVQAIGVCVPGIYRAESGTVWAPNIPGWDDYPLLAELRSCVGDDVRVTIDSDRAAYVLGESWRGVARGSRNVVFIAVGTGIGAGLLVDGRVLRGHADIAGALGWMALRQPYREAYAGCGCLEHHASGPGLVKVAREHLMSDRAYHGVLRGHDPHALSTHDLFAAAEAGDPLAIAVFEDAIGLWGMMAANVVSLFNPEMIVFGGGIFGPAARYLERIYEEALRWGQPISVRQATFATSALGGDAGLYGAAKLALDEAGSAEPRALAAR